MSETKAFLSGVAIVSTLFVFGSQSAGAADFPVYTKAPPPVVAPVYDWTGLYVGGHAGYGWATDKNTAVTPNPTFPAGFQFNDVNVGGGLGGVQGGFNYQIARWVLGIEGEFSWTNATGSSTTFSPLILGDRTIDSNKIDWVATAAGRVGYTWNNWLGYVKGGGAWAQANGGSNLFDPAGTNITGHPNKTGQLSGWLIGVGLEYGFWNNWSVKLEYDYLDFGTRRDTSIDKTFGLVELRDHSDTAQMVKIGVNYRFDFGRPR